MSRNEPIEIAPYDADWPGLFQSERLQIQTALARVAATIEHVGSTAVPGLAAKPIIDIMIGLQALELADACIEPVRHLGYEYVPEFESQMPYRRYFRKRDTRPGFHVHMVAESHEFWGRHLMFRDYLRAHPATAREYETLKRQLADRCQSHGEYTDGKTEFIRRIEGLARDWFATNARV